MTSRCRISWPSSRWLTLTRRPHQRRADDDVHAGHARVSRLRSCDRGGHRGAFGHLGAVATGYLGAWVLGFPGSVAYFAMLAVAMSACFVSLALVRRHVANG